MVSRRTFLGRAALASAGGLAPVSGPPAAAVGSSTGAVSGQFLSHFAEAVGSGMRLPDVAARLGARFGAEPGFAALCADLAGPGPGAAELDQATLERIFERHRGLFREGEMKRIRAAVRTGRLDLVALPRVGQAAASGAEAS